VWYLRPMTTINSALTDREEQVLALLQLGRDNAAIVAELEIGIGTVQNHVTSVCRKLGVTDRFAAAATARTRPTAVAGSGPQRRACARDGCDVEFALDHRGTRYCSPHCRELARYAAQHSQVPCPICGTLFDQRTDLHTPETCGNSCGQQLRMRRKGNTLTPRQEEVFSLIAHGLSTEEIAAHLHISRGTAKNLATTLYRRLGVSGRADVAAAWEARTRT